MCTAPAGQTKDNKISSGMSFTMGNYHDDQVLQILNDESYENGEGSIQRGLIINEFPVGSNIVELIDKFKELEKIENQKERDEKLDELWSKEGSKRRLFVGRSKENNSVLFLYAENGKPKLKIYIDKN